MGPRALAQNNQKIHSCVFESGPTVLLRCINITSSAQDAYRRTPNTLHVLVLVRTIDRIKNDGAEYDGKLSDYCHSAKIEHASTPCSVLLSRSISIHC
ncbi:hypothetical protein IG631_15176 [Alternaria alternata]|nr:hypothetical protein IG631_15176 [Alternaria alternata]